MRLKFFSRLLGLQCHLTPYVRCGDMNQDLTRVGYSRTQNPCFNFTGRAREEDSKFERGLYLALVAIILALLLRQVHGG